MNIKKLAYTFSIFVITLPLLALNANALDKYVTENLTVYLTRGPGTQFAIVGTLKAGDKITVLETSSDNQYTRIQQNNSKIGWVKSSNLTNTPSIKEQFSVLTEKFENAQQKVTQLEQDKKALQDDYTSQLDDAKQQIANLQQTNQQLQTTFDEQQAKITSLSESIDQKRQDLILSWFTRGGIVVGIAFILGLTLPIIMPRRRKKNGWMN